MDFNYSGPLEFKVQTVTKSEILTQGDFRKCFSQQTTWRVSWSKFEVFWIFKLETTENYWSRIPSGMQEGIILELFYPIYRQNLTFSKKIFSQNIIFSERLVQQWKLNYWRELIAFTVFPFYPLSPSEALNWSSEAVFDDILINPILSSRNQWNSRIQKSSPRVIHWITR